MQSNDMCFRLFRLKTFFMYSKSINCWFKAFQVQKLSFARECALPARWFTWSENSEQVTTKNSSVIPSENRIAFRKYQIHG